MQPDFPLDVTPPASTPVFPVTSAGLELPGVLHLPAGPGPHPVVLLLHGFPGNERNFDLAQLLRRAGYAALVFHYRGSWGAAGSFSWRNVLADCAAAVTALRTAADTHGLDAARVAVIGHSMGGFAALMTAAADPAIPAVASITGFDFGSAALACGADPALQPALVEAFDEGMLPLRGTNGARLVDEMLDAGAAWQLTALAPAFGERAVLLVGAEFDTAAPPAEHHDPLVAAYADARLHHHLLPTDHALSDHRQALGQIVVEFLQEHVPVA